MSTGREKCGQVATFEEPPRVVIYDPDRSDDVALANCLRGGGTNPTIHVPGDRDLSLLDAPDVDVAFVNVAGSSCNGLAFAAEVTTRWPCAEVVFWYRPGVDFPGTSVARDLGITRVIPLVSLESWASLALASLVRMARARRDYQSATQELPAIPKIDAAETTLCLPEAERRFREIYLRRILAESDNHTIAARRAGLPYTTFRSMLEKLGLLGRN